MLSIHNNLSAGAQNVTGAYVIVMLVYRRLLTTRLHIKQLCDSSVIANNARKTAKAICPRLYNLEVNNVIKYTRKHRAITNYITCIQGFCVTQ